ncbi:MAG: hypothetical protein K0R10_1069 [Alphaproteobacteria bacterium]|jgi:hypothetical protein|nr:hypothetical protein [Alphaproteobacteria bacterium]
MADNSDNNGGLYFIVGALVVAVAAMGYFYLADAPASKGGTTIAIERNVSPTEKPADFSLDIKRN